MQRAHRERSPGLDLIFQGKNVLEQTGTSCCYSALAACPDGHPHGCWRTCSFPRLPHDSPTPAQVTLARGPVLPQTCPPPRPGFCMSGNQGLRGLGRLRQPWILSQLHACHREPRSPPASPRSPNRALSSSKPLLLGCHAAETPPDCGLVSKYGGRSHPPTRLICWFMSAFPPNM